MEFLKLEILWTYFLWEKILVPGCNTLARRIGNKLRRAGGPYKNDLAIPYQGYPIFLISNVVMCNLKPNLFPTLIILSDK